MGSKQLYGSFKRLISNISHEKTWRWLRKGNLNRETEPLLIAAQNNGIRTNRIKARIDKTQQNIKCRWCWGRDETINHTISECRKLAQKEYNTRHAWVGKVIHWELYKKFKFDYTNKWYMHNLTSVLENETHKLLWDFNIQTGYLISARRPDLIIIIIIIIIKQQKTNKQTKKQKQKRTCKIVDFAVPVDHKVELKENKKDKYLDFASELKKKMEHERDIYTNCDWYSWYSHQRIIKGTGGLGKERTSGDHPNHYIIENGQNTEKSLKLQRKTIS